MSVTTYTDIYSARDCHLVRQTQPALSGGASAGVPQRGCLSGGASAGVPQRGCLSGGASAGVPQRGCLSGGASAGVPQRGCLSGGDSVGVTQWGWSSGPPVVQQAEQLVAGSSQVSHLHHLQLSQTLVKAFWHQTLQQGQQRVHRLVLFSPYLLKHTNSK